MSISPSKDQNQNQSHVRTNESDDTVNDDEHQNTPNLNPVQQQFVLKFCRQLVSVIQACEHSEAAEIELGRRHIDDQHITVKLQAKRQ